MKRFTFLLIFLVICINATNISDLPIILVHGINSDASGMKPTEEYIEKYLPGRYVKSVDLGCCSTSSFFSIHAMVNYLNDQLVNDEHCKNGCIMIGHSQGGIIARYYLEHYNNPPVHVYISWGSPQMGIFGSPGNFDNRFKPLNMLENYIYQLLYSSFFQKNFSFPNFWRDTLHYETYLHKCRFLPYLNNELMHSNAGQYKQNICSLQAMVLVQSTQEYIVEPAASCHFGFYKIGTKHEDSIESLFESKLYQSDLLGLKTLHEDDRLHLLWTDCLHENMQEDESNFVKNTLPFLTTQVIAT